MAFTATNFVTECISAYPNCKEFLITYSKCKDKEIKDFLDLLDINIDKLDVNISNELSNNGIIMNSNSSYMYIHGFRDKDDSVMIKAKHIKIFLSK